MKSHLDLRCARRLTVAEGRLLLDLLSDVAGLHAKKLRVKLAVAGKGAAVRASLLELNGKVLGCWCKKRGDEPCHGDVIVKLIEELKA